MNTENNEVRYSDEDLRNFKTLISNTMDAANDEIKYLKVVLQDVSRNIKVEGFENDSPRDVEAQIDRVESYIKELEKAIDRIRNKTYGVCESTGQLISKEVLLSAPVITRIIPTPEIPASVNDNSEKPPVAVTVRKCRKCGCTEDDCSQCIEKTGQPCHWVEEDLCSACVEEKTAPADQNIEPSENDENLLVKAPERIQLTDAEIKHLNELENNLTSSNNNDMNFFQQLAQASAQQTDLTMRIMQKGTKLTINIMPGAGSSAIKPILVTGTAQELDAEFFKTIAPGITEVKGLVTNLEQVKKDLEKQKVEKPAAASNPSGSHKPAAKKTEKKPEKKEVKKEPAPAEPNMFA